MGSLLVAQSSDDIAQRRQGLVDVLRLLEPVTSGIRLAHTLGARQVDQMQLA
jgi:hypothetical protein